MAIKFSLICECSAKFEGWFPGNKEYEQQVKTGKLMCPMCDSTNVRKDIMAPSVKRKSKQIKGRGQGNLMMSGRARQILQTIEQTVKREYTDVGKKFAQEARKASRGERDEKIYGTATKKEVKQLQKDGIDIFPVPEIKDN